MATQRLDALVEKDGATQTVGRRWVSLKFGQGFRAHFSECRPHAIVAER